MVDVERVAAAGQFGGFASSCTATALFALSGPVSVPLAVLGISGLTVVGYWGGKGVAHTINYASSIKDQELQKVAPTVKKVFHEFVDENVEKITTSRPIKDIGHGIAWAFFSLAELHVVHKAYCFSQTLFTEGQVPQILTFLAVVGAVAGIGSFFYGAYRGLRGVDQVFSSSDKGNTEQLMPPVFGPISHGNSFLNWAEKQRFDEPSHLPIFPNQFDVSPKPIFPSEFFHN